MLKSEPTAGLKLAQALLKLDKAPYSRHAAATMWRHATPDTKIEYQTKAQRLNELMYWELEF